MSDKPFQIKVEDREALALVETIGERVASGFGEEFGVALEAGRRYAVSISPVVTGSYAGAHRVAVDAEQAELGIDLLARNVVTGTPVIDYAGAVEERHHVYGRVLNDVERYATDAVELALRELL